MCSKQPEGIRYRFGVNEKDAWLPFLRTEGYVVLKEALSSEEARVDSLLAPLQSCYKAAFYADPGEVGNKFDLE